MKGASCPCPLPEAFIIACIAYGRSVKKPDTEARYRSQSNTDRARNLLEMLSIFTTITNFMANVVKNK